MGDSVFMSSNRRYEITPQMEDYDKLEPNWTPLLMFFQKPNMEFKSVSTDKFGFRTTYKKNNFEKVKFENFKKKTNEAKGIILGGSTAFGVGSTHDKYTIPSLLNEFSDTVWFNFGGRAFSSTQEALLLLLNRPVELDHIVIFSGINNLTLSCLSNYNSSVYNSFYFQNKFDQSMFFDCNQIMGVKYSFLHFLKQINAKITNNRQKYIPKTKILDQEKYDNVLLAFKRDIDLLSLLSKDCNCKISFVFQPIATWIEKKLSKEEKELFEILDNHSAAHWKILSTYIKDKQQNYIEDVKNICESFNVPFIDLNSYKDFTREEWLFVDRAHLTDSGNKLVFKIILEELL